MDDDEEMPELQYDALEHLAGYICSHSENPDYLASDKENLEYTWTNHLREGGLKKPSLAFMNKMEKLQAIFTDVNKDKLIFMPGYLKYLVSKAVEIELEDRCCFLGRGCICE